VFPSARRRGHEVRGRVAKFASARVGLGEGAKRGEVCSPARCLARVDVGEGAGTRGPQLGGVAMSVPRQNTRKPTALSPSGGLGRYWAAQWHLARAVGKRFWGCREKHLYVH